MGVTIPSSVSRPWHFAYHGEPHQISCTTLIVFTVCIGGECRYSIISWLDSDRVKRGETQGPLLDVKPEIVRVDY